MGRSLDFWSSGLAPALLFAYACRWSSGSGWPKWSTWSGGLSRHDAGMLSSWFIRHRVAIACWSSWLGFGACAAAACGSVDHDLQTARALYSDARYEDADARLVELRSEYADLSKPQRATLHFLSGMTAYRLGQPDEALHELALAAHAARDQASPLGTEQLALLYRTLEELMESRHATRLR